MREAIYTIAVPNTHAPAEALGVLRHVASTFGPVKVVRRHNSDALQLQPDANNLVRVFLFTRLVASDNQTVIELKCEFEGRTFNRLILLTFAFVFFWTIIAVIIAVFLLAGVDTAADAMMKEICQKTEQLILASDTATAEADAAYRRGDYATALRRYRLLADRGNAVAQFTLGVMYTNGQGVPQDYAEAPKWYHLAANQGDANSQCNLGVIYANGQGVQQDYVRAHMWFNLSVAQGNPNAAFQDMAIKNRDLIASTMTPAQIEEAQRLAHEWKPTR